ncbi:MAG: RidA family protein [Pseudomonadota bacterium]|nr:RidA family protein [Pseudomonadota bacterium]
MSFLEKKVVAMGYTLPKPWPYPSPNRTAVVRVEPILFVSGHGPGLPHLPGVRHKGKVRIDVSLEEGQATAHAVMLMILASLKEFTGNLDRVKRVVPLFGMVNSSPNFWDYPEVIDGASDFVYELWSPKFGQHARNAIGASGLPHDIVVEVNGEFEISDG